MRNYFNLLVTKKVTTNTNKLMTCTIDRCVHVHIKYKGGNKINGVELFVNFIGFLI